MVVIEVSFNGFSKVDASPGRGEYNCRRLGQFHDRHNMMKTQQSVWQKGIVP